MLFLVIVVLLASEAHSTTFVTYLLFNTRQLTRTLHDEVAATTAFLAICELTIIFVVDAARIIHFIPFAVVSIWITPAWVVFALVRFNWI